MANTNNKNNKKNVWKVVGTDLLINRKKYKEGEIVKDEKVVKKAEKYFEKIEEGGEE